MVVAEGVADESETVTFPFLTPPDVYETDVVVPILPIRLSPIHV
jgi:hypothetical protein